ncbi:Aquaporin [Hondaea fermentalgiana]|uniref:Aquaporin n=1 Tax=Hondaea fermentalgiana TaxID=2315210 RepID=A0A2R5GQ76_9STRA|nr:Aquaporin [Hondaea fermentalgiana]|eukprot:GBG30034.1 Aquaporin [Hondaea fermentalgiana]
MDQEMVYTRLEEKGCDAAAEREISEDCTGSREKKVLKFWREAATECMFSALMTWTGTGAVALVNDALRASGDMIIDHGASYYNPESLMATVFIGAFFGSILLLASRESVTVHDTELDMIFGIWTLDLGENYLSALMSPQNGFLLELTATCMICVTVLATVVIPDLVLRGKPETAPLPVAATTFIAHILLEAQTSCGTNPARTLAPVAVHLFMGHNIWVPSMWIFIAGPILGATLAATLFEVFQFRPAEDDPSASVAGVGELETPLTESHAQKSDILQLV